ncbi:MAG: glycosyltransferase family 2 protein [Flavobacteriaceae bacterium]|nr:glycosyltransferase family 2 protein [Flavobacteriaceae bacterium]
MLKSLVSIITPTFNSEEFISQTIDSIVDQSYKTWELIVVDDCSVDNTIQLIKTYQKKHANISLIQNPVNQGAGISRNKGINAAKGDFIAFLDADDLWKPNKLEVQIEFMKNNNIDVCFSRYDLIDEQGFYLNKRIKALSELTYNKLLKSNYIGNLTGVYNCKTLGKIPSTKLRKRQDWILWLEAIKKSNKPAVGIQEPLAYYRVRKNSMSSNKFNLIWYNFQVYRKGLGFSMVKSIIYFIIFLFEHIFVKSKQVVNLPKS